MHTRHSRGAERFGGLPDKLRAVAQHDDGRVARIRVFEETERGEGHHHRLTAALVMPDEAALAAAAYLVVERCDSCDLRVAGNHLRHHFRGGGGMAEQRERLEHQQHRLRREESLGRLLGAFRPGQRRTQFGRTPQRPGLVVGFGADGANPQLVAVCRDVEDVGRKDVWVLGFVDVVDVFGRGQPGGALLYRVLRLDDNEGEPVDVEHDVEATRGAGRSDGDLVGHDELVGTGVSEFDEPAGHVLAVSGDERVLAAQHDGHPLVGRDQTVPRCGGGGEEFIEYQLGAGGVLLQFRVEATDRIPHPRFNEDVVVVAGQ